MKNDGWKLEDSLVSFWNGQWSQTNCKTSGVLCHLHKKQGRNTTTDGTCSSVNFSTFLGVPKDMRQKGCEEPLEKQCRNFNACSFFLKWCLAFLCVYGVLYKNFLRKPLSIKKHSLFGGSWRNQGLSLWRPVKIGLKNKIVFTWMELPQKYLHQNKRKQQDILWKPGEYWVKSTNRNYVT